MCIYKHIGCLRYVYKRENILTIKFCGQKGGEGRIQSLTERAEAHRVLKDPKSQVNREQARLTGARRHVLLGHASNERTGKEGAIRARESK